MLTRAEKQGQFEQLRETLSEVNSIFVLSNHGLLVNEVNELRTMVRNAEASYQVFKNSVVKLAVEGTPMEGLSPKLTGPNALAYTDTDAVALAKVLRDFIKTHPKLVFEQAFLEGQILNGKEAEKIADLPSREELIAKLLYMLQSPIRRLAVALNGPIQNFTSVVHQVAEQHEKQDS